MVRFAVTFLLILTTFVASAQKNVVDSVAYPTPNSLLSQGKWFMIKVDTSGVYRLTYDELLKIGVTNPAETRIFSYGGRNLPLYCGNNVPDDLNEIPVIMDMGTDSVFNSGDKLVFYAQGPVVLDYNSENGVFVHSRHHYSGYTYLLLTSDLGRGLSMPTVSFDSMVVPDTVRTYDGYGYFGREKYNLINSGLRWYDNRLTANTIDSVQFHFHSIVDGEPVKCLALAAGRMVNGTSAAYFRYRYNGQDVAISNIVHSYNDYLYADFCQKQFSFNVGSSNFYLAYGLTSSNVSTLGHIYKICVNAREWLSYDGKHQLHFRDARTAKADAVVFEINNNGNEPLVMDITNPVSPFLVRVSHSETASRFIAQPRGTIREFVTFEAGNLLSPITSDADLGEVDNQNLHGAPTPDMLIVTHPDFMDQANELAELHHTCDGFDVQVVTQQQIFNEFSGGTPDVAAIRNYARLLHQRGDKFGYLLLLGDGTYDNRNITGSNSNFILTFQTENAESQSLSCGSDDFFGMLEDGEGELTGTLDIAVGRLPVNSVKEAQDMVDKIRRHLTGRDPGGWPNNIAIIADDEENGDFVNDAEKICEVIDKKQPEYNINKIYLDSYEQISGSSGATYPTVNEIIKKMFVNGAAVIEYIGHGGQRKLSHESVFMQSDANALTNTGRMPFVITASCEVGRFDDHQFTSLGEILVKNPKGAAIAALVTTRVVYNSANCELSRNIFSQNFGSGMRIGDIVMNAKNATGTISSDNKRKFVLLGDPAIRLAPGCGNTVKVTKINGRSTGMASDTINAVDTVTIEGYTCRADGSFLDADGILYVTVFDKKAAVSTRANDKNSPVIRYEAQNSVLYQGRVSITDGMYKFSFIVPKDINYSYGYGKISLYAVLDSIEATGYSNSILIGGTPQYARVTDFDGPEIEIFITDTIFTDGFIVGSNPIVMARLYDESGINTTGNGIGHDIVAMVDYDMRSSMVLNDCYEGNIDQYNSGELRFNLYNLEDGEHTLSLKAWDIYNNPSEVEITFVVRNSKEPAIGTVYNYPNPVVGDTYFYINHNQVDNIVDVSVTIYDSQGRQVDRIIEKRGVGDTSPIYWQCQRNGRRIDSGIYIYVTEISGPMGKCTKSGKMVVARQ